MLKQVLKDMSIFDGLLKASGYRFHDREIQFSTKYPGEYAVSAYYTNGNEYRGYEMYWHGNSAHILYHAPDGSFQHRYFYF